jgi:hypothetical protein
MKKYMPGFVPVNFKQVGKLLLIVAIIVIIIKAIAALTDWFNFPNLLLYFGLILLLLSFYLIRVVPEE